MATISYDGQSWIVAGRRVWIVSGSIPYARIPHQLWRSRIRAAKQAGLNCIDTYAYWNLHEPKPGRFNFEHDLNLRRFVETVGEEGMFCILRPGPYVGGGYDFGGLPAWLHRVEGLKLRQANGPFLEACSRYLGAVLGQVKDLQVTSSQPGPILLMGAENRWFCSNPQQAQGYLLEISRYLRENGCAVPIIECNNLWSSTEGAIGCWSGADHLATDLRQMAVVQPHTPRLVVEYTSSGLQAWGHKPPNALDAAGEHERRLASVLAVGAQYNDVDFHGGTHTGFAGGRTALMRSGYLTTSHGWGTPLTEAGGRGAKYLATKRISVFASQFSQLLAHLDPSDQHAAVALSDGRHGLSVIHQRGAAGQVVFLFKDRRDKTQETQLMLPNGVTLPVPLGKDGVAWVVLEADLAGVATLNYTNLRPWAFLDRRVLVLFGPPGAQGQVCINHSTLRVKVPTGKIPLVEPHEELTVVVLNRQQVDAAYIGPEGLVVGAGGLDDQDHPIALAGWPQATLVGHDGKTQRQPLPPLKRPTAPRITGWQRATLSPFLAGTDDRFEPIDGPASLEALGCDWGYGWYRFSVKSSTKGKLLAAEAADRLHLYHNGQLAAVLGQGPGADSSPCGIHLSGQVTVLADNLGRYSDGWLMGEAKGLYGHLYAVKPVKLAKPKVVQKPPPDLFSLNGFFPFVHSEDRPIPHTLSWEVRPVGKNPLILEIDQLPMRVLLLVNGEPVGAYDPAGCGLSARYVFHVGQQLKSGANKFKLAVFTQQAFDTLRQQAPSKHLRLYQATANLTAISQWAFAKWVLPDGAAFKPLGRSTDSQPCWYQARFNTPRLDVPLWLEPVGMSKGQIYINGHNAGRYFVSTHVGKAVGPQKRYYLPQPWLHTDQPNQLLLFDEHGRSPDKCRLVYDAMGPYGK